MCTEITVICKDSEKTLRKKFLIYDIYTVDERDPVIEECVEQTVTEFGDEPDDVKLKISMSIR